MATMAAPASKNRAPHASEKCSIRDRIPEQWRERMQAVILSLRMTKQA